jgi:signal transduction histidine kinase
VRESERSQRDLDASERIRDLCHEIKNPLGGVRGLAALLDRELSRLEDSERARRLLAQMIRGLEVAEGVLHDAADPQEDPADGGRVAEEVVGLALAESRAQGREVRFRVEAPEGIELPLSAVRFREILSNLVRNAAEAGGAGGIVTVTLRSDLDGITFFVEDDGVGLPRVPDAVLFGRGFSTKGKGRGRGLAVTAERVDAAGGTLTYGRLERGTIARVRIPRR